MPITLDRRPLTDSERHELAGSTTRLWLLAIPGVVFRYVLVFLLLMGLVMAIVAVQGEVMLLQRSFDAILAEARVTV